VKSLSTLIACLLALLVASPLCCCAAEKEASTPVTASAPAEETCCCCHHEQSSKEEAPKKSQSPEKSCLCASKQPKQSPDPLADLPAPAVQYLILPPLWLALLPLPEPAPVIEPFTRQDFPPWLPPPSERRALLVSRVI